MRLLANLKLKSSLVRHPRGQAGKRAVWLSNDDELNAAAIKPPGDEHGLTVAGMEPIGDPTFNRLFVGIMSCV
jgi:hypothetical protein